ncbi:hypothetical protein PoB_007218700 [Plakobranchus ocellatus]|uniref:Uncharacterized protein n=1 Tax=Plakobranchus ocellatus TaxID=259542 RepID=A0AAV4DNN0_9GAST|nr:hypothetical protein PoB_007218700 [Plakobranchus ocellatus]
MAQRCRKVINKAHGETKTIKTLGFEIHIGHKTPSASDTELSETIASSKYPRSFENHGVTRKVRKSNLGKGNRLVMMLPTDGTVKLPNHEKPTKTNSVTDGQVVDQPESGLKRLKSDNVEDFNLNILFKNVHCSSFIIVLIFIIGVIISTSLNPSW